MLKKAEIMIKGKDGDYVSDAQFMLYISILIFKEVNVILLNNL